MTNECSVAEPAKTLAAIINSDTQDLPIEILLIDAATAALVIEINGVDYILTMQRVPEQRARPIRN